MNKPISFSFHLRLDFDVVCPPHAAVDHGGGVVRAGGGGGGPGSGSVSAVLGRLLALLPG